MNNYYNINSKNNSVNILLSFITTHVQYKNKKFLILLNHQVEAKQICGMVCEQLSLDYIVSNNTDYKHINKLIEKSKVNIILSSKQYINILNQLQWECNCFNTYICIDTENIYLEHEPKNKLMNKKIWNYISNNANDDIEAGGWFNSYTREKFSQKEMQEYVNNTVYKLSPYINSNQIILEIGCSSGVTMFNLVSKVKKYIGLDMSNSLINRGTKVIQQMGIQNIKLYCMEAKDINQVKERDIDIIIMNSVIHCFSGLNYLRRVLQKAIGIMKDKGIIYIGDVMNLELKKQLQQSLDVFKLNNPSYNTKQDITNELFVSKLFFEDLAYDFKEIEEVTIRDKTYTIENELTQYRYDVIIKIDRNRLRDFQAVKNKYQLSCNIYN